MFEIFIDSNFSAAHNLRNYNGKCEYLHGHNYKVRVYICGKELDKTGMLLDFTILKKQLKKIIYELDHKYLNEVKPFDKINPTAENIAKHIYDKIRLRVKGKRLKVNRVSVWETDGSCATYYEK